MSRLRTQPSTVSGNIPFLSRHSTLSLTQREKTVVTDFFSKTTRGRTKTKLELLEDEIDNNVTSSGGDSQRSSSTVTIDFSDITDTKHNTTLSKIHLPKKLLQGSWCEKLYQIACRRLGISAQDYVIKALNTSTLTVKSRYPKCDEILSLAISITENTSLHEINLIDNKLDEKSIAYLCSGVTENVLITRFVLSGNVLNDNSVKMLTDLVSQTHHLREVCLADNNIRDVHGPLVASMISENTSVVYLDLSYNQLGDDAASDIGPSLASNDTIRNLNLSWNCFRQTGVKSLVRGLVENVGIRTLNLSMNGLGVEGAGYVTRYLINNETLISLDISRNRITDLGFELLAKMISRNKTLKEIYLGHNLISTTGANRILTEFYKNKNSSLGIIDLTGTYLDRNTHELASKIQSERPYVQFEVHGIVEKSTEMKTKELERGIIDHDSPLEILRFYVEKTGSRVVDVFKIFDAENRNSITKSDLVRGLEKINVILTQKQVDALFSALDSDGSGDINFGELMAGDREARTTLRKKGIKAKEFQSEQDKKNQEFADLQ